MTFLEALQTGRPMRRGSWWQGNPGDRWLVFTLEGEWTWPRDTIASEEALAASEEP